ncbi:MAG: EAL domain-containing protein [Comamonadaceae bacterium]|nr:EAL domain-containing protein [Comamonadaceae bacterium]
MAIETPPSTVADSTDSGQSVDELQILRTWMQRSAIGLIVVDALGIIKFVNPAAQALCACMAAQLLGRNCVALFAQDLTPAETLTMQNSLAAAQGWSLETLIQRMDGTQFWGNFQLVPVEDALTGTTLRCLFLNDISNLKHAADKIQRLSSFDQLTLLPNRAQFMRSLQQLLSGAGDAGDFVLMVWIDVDHLRTINDTMGHAVADLVLQSIANRLRDASRRQDLLARLGGDEFALVISGGTDPQVLQDAAERLMRSLQMDLATPDCDVKFSLTAGTAIFPPDARYVEDLMSCAELALLEAKKAGDGAIRHYVTELGNTGTSHAQAVAELRTAIFSEELRLHFQPQLSLHSGQVIGLEALVRWQHPTRGLISPVHFIALAEECGLIIPLGEWVMQTAVKQIRAWRDDGLTPVRVAVNLSAPHFRQKGLPDAIEKLLFEHDVPASLFELELTESVMMRDAEAAIHIVDRLKAIGLRISLDDFGTGYSSLAYLSRFAIDVIKIDQSFVADITTNPVNASIATATIAMAHKLGKTVIAEGVETQGQMVYLRRHECDEMQGYLFSQPVDAAAISAMLRSGAGINLSLDQGDAQMTLLLVDDEPNILNAIKRLLRREGYRILCAESAAQGLDLLATHRVQVVISDQRMPVMTGTEFLSRVKELYPDTVRLVLSGYSELESLTDAINKGAIYRYISKPWDDDSFKQDVIQAFRHYREHNPASPFNDHEAN